MKTITLALVAGLACSAAALADPGTAFTYQGQLKNGGTLASGGHDFRFRLFDAASGGGQVGTTLCADDVQVVDGVFAVSLDFGDVFSAGEPLFLEIDARQDTGLNCSNAGGFVSLAGRQTLSITPFAGYATQARNASNAQNADNTNLFGGQSSTFYRNASNLNAGTINDLRLSTNVPRLNAASTFTGVVNMTNPANVFAGTGEGLVGLSASNLATGTVPDARLPSDLARVNAANLFTNAGNVFVGDGSGLTGLSAAGLSGQIVGAQIANDSIGTFHIAPGAIIGSDISDNSIGTTKILNGAITSFKLAAGSVSGGVGGTIVDGSIGNADLQASIIASVNIIDGTITASDLAADSVNGAHIVDNAVGAADIAAGAVGASEIADGSVGSAEIATNAVTGTKLAVDAVSNTRLALDAASLARVSGGAMQSNGLRVGIAGAVSATNELMVNGRIESLTGLTTPGTITAAEYTFVNPFPRVTTITPFHFTLRDGGIEIGGVDSDYVGEPHLYNVSDVVSAEAAAPLTLPDGATVTRVDLIAEDDAVSDDIHILVLRRTLTATPGGTMASISTSGDVLGFRTFSDTTISGGTIDNDSNMYYVTLKFDPALATLKFKGLVVHYTVARPLP